MYKNVTSGPSYISTKLTIAHESLIKEESISTHTIECSVCIVTFVLTSTVTKHTLLNVCKNVMSYIMQEQVLWVVPSCWHMNYNAKDLRSEGSAQPCILNLKWISFYVMFIIVCQLALGFLLV